MSVNKMTSSERAAYNRCCHCLLELIAKYGPEVKAEAESKKEASSN